MGILSAKAENNSAHHQQMSDFEAAEIVYLSPPNRRFREGDTMNLRSVLLATAMASGMCSYAMAADMPLKAPPPPAPVEVYSWTGFYLGGNLGGEWSRYHSTITSGNGSVRASEARTPQILLQVDSAKTRQLQVGNQTAGIFHLFRIQRVISRSEPESGVSE
jgi:hypothetical protein